MAKKKHGYAKHFKEALNGRCPFFVMKLYSPYYYQKEIREKLEKKLREVPEGGFRGVHSYYYNLKISLLIEKGIIPESARFLDKYWESSHQFVFCKPCIDSIQKVFKILNIERVGALPWELITFVREYQEVGLALVSAIADCEMPCPLPGHPSHNPVALSLEATAAQELESAQSSKLSLDHPAERIFEADWGLVEDFLQKLYNCSCTKEILDVFENQHHCIEKLRRHVEEMIACHDDSQRRIYDQLSSSFENHLINMCRTMDSDDEDLFLQKISENWDVFYTLISRSVLVFSPVGPSFLTSFWLGLHLWEVYILHSRLINVLVTRSRTPKDIMDSNIVCELKCMVRMFPHVYQRFERQFLKLSQKVHQANAQGTKQFYSYSEISIELVELGADAEVFQCWELYLQDAEELYDGEVQLAKYFLDDTGQLRLLNLFREEYYRSDWMAQCFAKSFHKEDYAVIGRMKRMLDRLPSGSLEMKQMLLSHVAETVRLVIDGSEDATNGKHLLEARDKYDHLISESLKNDKTLEQALNISFRKAVNSNNKYVKCVLAYIDLKFREAANLNMNAEEETEEAYKFAIKYFGGDMFKQFYQQYMADRLIELASTCSMERHALERLKIQFGNKFTSELEQMLDDMESGQQITDVFRNNFPSLTESPDVNFMVLDSRVWRLKQRQQVHLPHDVRPVMEKFHSNYTAMGSSHRKKKLELQTHLGFGTLKAYFLDQETDLVVSTPQMAILMLFNSGDSLTYREIREGTGMSDADLKLYLLSLLAVDGTGILNLTRRGESELSEHDILSINKKFNGEPNLYWKHDFDPGVLVEAVYEAEKHHINAAIARIMKSKKFLDHPTLIREVTDDLHPRFTTTPAAIKGRIEHLIEDLGLLERDKNDPSCYRYLPT